MNTLVLNRRRTSIWGGLAILAAAATALSIYSYLSYLRAQLPVAGRLVPMVVAAEDLEPGTVLAARMLVSVDHPEKFLPNDAVGDVGAVIGKTLAMPLLDGEPLTTRKLSSKGGLSSVVPKGMRAYSLSTTSGSSLSFLPKTGDRVDVIVTFPPEVLGQASSITVLRHKEVASVGASAAPSSDKVSEQLSIEGTKGLSITLFVTPEEAEHLALAEALGRIKVTLAPQRPEEGPAPGPVTPKQIGTA